MQNSQQIFKLHSEYKPTGDQPQAIEKLVKGFKEGNQFETLLGVTGSGKTWSPRYGDRGCNRYYSLWSGIY